MKPINVYDGKTLRRLAFLQNAYDIGYEKSINALWTGSFSMPYSDTKNQYCDIFNLVEIWDVDAGKVDRRVGLFRIMSKVEETVGNDAYVNYSLEHVLNTLIDDIMIGFHSAGGSEMHTEDAINYILQQQSQQKWILELCDYDFEYLYEWQDENLLSALYSITDQFPENDYYWDFDTNFYPWHLRLSKAKEYPVMDIRYRKNISGITRTTDSTNLATRLYCYGYSDGTNKLNISSVNDGVLYLLSPNVSKYGLITQVWTDERYTVPESLKSAGEAILKKMEEPAITYEFDIQTINSTANLSIGDTVRVVSEGVDDYMIVQKIIKTDVSGSPLTGQVILGHGTMDIADSIANIAEKQYIRETYIYSPSTVSCTPLVAYYDSNATAQASTDSLYSVTWSATGLPDGFIIDEESGFISGSTKADESSGTFTVIATTSNDTTITSNPISYQIRSRAPTDLSGNDITYTQTGVQVTALFTVTRNGGQIIWTKGNNPGWMTIIGTYIGGTDNNTAYCTVSGTPSSSDIGPYSLVMTAKNSAGSVSKTVTVQYAG